MGLVVGSTTWRTGKLGLRKSHFFPRKKWASIVLNPLDCASLLVREFTLESISARGHYLQYWDQFLMLINKGETLNRESGHWDTPRFKIISELSLGMLCV